MHLYDNVDVSWRMQFYVYIRTSARGMEQSGDRVATIKSGWSSCTGGGSWAAGWLLECMHAGSERADE